MSSQDAPDSLNLLVNEIASGLEGTVAGIEANKIPTTKDNYGDYLGIMNQLGCGSMEARRIIAIALIKAGANENGVSAALKICG